MNCSSIMKWRLSCTMRPSMMVHHVQVFQTKKKVFPFNSGEFQCRYLLKIRFLLEFQIPYRKRQFSDSSSIWLGYFLMI